MGRIEAANHHDLQQRVEHGADRHRGENRAREISLGIARLAGEMDRLFEALQPEHHAAGQRGKDAVKAERHEAAAGVEVRRIELQRGHDADREHGHGRLPDDDDDVAVRDELGARQIHRGEQHHQDQRDGEPGAVQEAGVLADLVDHVEVLIDPADAVDVGDRRQHLEGRDEDRLQPGRPSGDEAGDRAVRVAAETSRLRRPPDRSRRAPRRPARAATACRPRGSTTEPTPGRPARPR